MGPGFCGAFGNVGVASAGSPLTHEISSLSQATKAGPWKKEKFPPTCITQTEREQEKEPRYRLTGGGNNFQSKKTF